MSTAVYAQARTQLVTATPMSEVTLLGRVRHLCDLYGTTHYHTRDSRGSNPGFPDLVIVGPGGVLWRELKVKGRTLTIDQRRWQRALMGADQDHGVWTEQDYASGRITAEIARISQLAAIQQLPLAG